MRKTIAHILIQEEAYEPTITSVLDTGFSFSTNVENIQYFLQVTRDTVSQEPLEFKSLEGCEAAILFYLSLQ